MITVAKEHNLLVKTAAVGIILVVLHLAQPIVIPFLLAALIAVGVSAVVRWDGSGLKRWGSVMLAALTAVAVIAAIFGLLAFAVRDVVESWPEYSDAWNEGQRKLARWFWQMQLTAPAAAVRTLEPEDAAMKLAGPGIALVTGIASNALLVLILTIFLLVEAGLASEKFKKLEKIGALNFELVESTARDVQRYLWTKTATSTVTGLCVAGLCAGVGLRHALTFGLLAFLLDFIPSVGNMIAAIPPILLGFAVLDASSVTALIVGYAAINMIVSMIIEPRVMGHAADLSPAVVILSMIFWGFLLGPVGALISVPLTMMVRIAASRFPQWKWLEIALQSARST